MSTGAFVTICAISSLGRKGSACFLPQGGGRRFLLDLGYGPQPGLLPDVDGSREPVRAISPASDHVGGLALLPRIGPADLRREMVARRIPDRSSARLPLRGAADILGVGVELVPARRRRRLARFALGDGVLSPAITRAIPSSMRTTRRRRRGWRSSIHPTASTTRRSRRALRCSHRCLPATCCCRRHPRRPRPGDRAADGARGPRRISTTPPGQRCENSPVPTPHACATGWLP